MHYNERLARRADRSALFLYATALYAVAAVLSGCGGGSSDSALAVREKTLAQACAEYRPSTLPHGAKFTKTELRAANGFLPETCAVRGVIVSSAASTINWVIDLPDPSKWNGKTLTIGGSGFDGFIPSDSQWHHWLVGESATPYVKISSDSGHQIEGFYPWGLDEAAIRNHAFDANHFSLEIGTQVAKEFYGKAPTRRYMMGQSNGGRQGLISAQRYPADYDGIVSMEPAMSQQGHQVNMGDLMKWIFASKDNWLSPAKTELFAAAEIAACDALDGVKDGIISNVAACSYIPSDLLCQGADNDTCLTAGQVETIRRIYSDHKVQVTLANGVTGYPRFGRSGAASSDWKSYLFGSSFDSPGFNYIAPLEAAKVVENNPDVDLMSHDPTLFAAQYLKLSNMIDGNNPDIKAFADKGGKLLLWYGMADSCVSVYRAADWFKEVTSVVGEAKTRNFARFLTSPGVSHELDGPGAGSADLLAALDAWVERGEAPNALVASKYEAAQSVTAKRGAPVLQRPLCEYPKFPRYTSGDPAKASSFVCSET
ncbi:tannase/feruloyl esterase family alpha/beta hydrolase [Variovorax sp. HJSM1_2]|uniref:tannase/feruloyl esterase family alpha/beta hydrolase n=1 Tax=Variovorax sp. HJSM1_2 TaxID=3366263 RepID=UPI003BCD8C8F